MQHTKKDLEIDPKRVKRIQNTVNDHVKWLGEMSNLGSNWIKVNKSVTCRSL